MHHVPGLGLGNIMDQPAEPASGQDPVAEGDRVLAGLRRISPPEVLGAHDSDLHLVDGRAFVAYMANDRCVGENPEWPDVYCVLTEIDVANGKVRKHCRVAASGMSCGGMQLPTGACFVPRLVAVGPRTLRCFFASEEPSIRESQSFFRDFDVATSACQDRFGQAKLQTDLGLGPMRPGRLHLHGMGHGFARPACRYGLYMIDGIKLRDGRYRAVLNNFASGQLAVAELDADMEKFTVIGDIPVDGRRLDEAALEQMADGSWLAVARHEDGDRRYRFSTSADCRVWTVPELRGQLPDGTPSRPTLDRHGDVWALGWNAAERVDGVHRSVFHLDVSRDGITWRRRFTFATRDSFQYPVFRTWGDEIFLSVTQGPNTNDGHSGKGRMMFGRLCRIDELL